MKTTNQGSHRMREMKMYSQLCIVLLWVIIMVKSGYCVENYIKDISELTEPLDGDGMTQEDERIWCTPEQVHLAYGGSVFDVTVMWATRGHCKMGVRYAAHPWNLDLQAEGRDMELNYAENKSYKYIHRADLKGLLPSTTYYFRPVTNHDVGIQSLIFKTPGTCNETWSPHFLVASNLDSETTIKSIVKKVRRGDYNALLYNGDLSAKLVPKFEQKDTSFLSQIAQAASFLPFMTAPGRKDTTDNEDGLYMYRNIFSMPGAEWPMSPNKLWYSLNIGPVHLISYSTDVLFDSDAKNANLQRDWLVKDLTEANEKREETPWVIAFGSHPMYCSFGVSGVDDCAQNTSKVKHGLEDIFYHFAVDLIITSRHTLYERSWPQYKGVVINTTYHQPRAPIEVIIGSGSPPLSTPEDNSTTSPNPATPAEWSAFHLMNTTDNSFGSLSVINASHLEWTLFSPDGNTVLDSFWVVQDNHGNFSLANLPHNVSHQINQTIIALGGKPGTYDFISGSTGDPSEGEGLSKYSLWLGLGVLAVVMVLVLGLVAVRSCMRRKRARAGRRWRDVDGHSGEGSFYSVASDTDTDDNDFEIDVYDRTNKQSSKLLTPY
ncbi:unnamed protein product [Lymnaea stagnalis]|uniref:Acid phosphatase n=1 Tax=Lymnaea stagnalis TaxID=6523 RepID=A0AAV2INU9_LYMST